MSDKTVRFAGAARQSGFTSIENSLLFDTALTAGARLAYLLLSSYAWQGDECWPGQDRLSETLAVTKKTMRGYIAELVAAGLLEVKRRGQGHTNLYTLHAPDSRRVEITSLDVSLGPPEEDEGEEGTYREPSSSSTGLELRRTGTPARAQTLGEREGPNICERLADKIEANGCRRPTVTKAWEKECRLLIDRDGVQPNEVRAAIDWATSHHFWKANILSMPTLRRQFDRLRLQAEAERTAPSATKTYDAAMESLRVMAES